MALVGGGGLRRAGTDLKNPELCRVEAALQNTGQNVAAGGQPTFPDLLGPAGTSQTSEEAGREVQTRPGGAAKGRRAQMDGESRTRSFGAPSDVASFSPRSWFQRKSRNRKSDVLFSVFLRWQTRENLSYSTSAPVQLPRNRLLHRPAAVPPAFPCPPPSFSDPVHQRERLPGGRVSDK